MRFNKAKRFLTVPGVVLLLLGGCNEQFSESPTKRILGSWHKVIGTSVFTFSFAENGSYTLKMHRDQVFEGTYEVSEKSLRLVDTFCGTKLPGIYAFSVEEDQISFEMLEDEFCARTDFVPGDWSRKRPATRNERKKETEVVPGVKKSAEGDSASGSI